MPEPQATGLANVASDWFCQTVAPACPAAVVSVVGATISLVGFALTLWQLAQIKKVRADYQERGRYAELSTKFFMHFEALQAQRLAVRASEAKRSLHSCRADLSALGEVLKPNHMVPIASALETITQQIDSTPLNLAALDATIAELEEVRTALQNYQSKQDWSRNG